MQIRNEEKEICVEWTDLSVRNGLSYCKYYICIYIYIIYVRIPYSLNIVNILEKQGIVDAYAKQAYMNYYVTLLKIRNQIMSPHYLDSN